MPLGFGPKTATCRPWVERRHAILALRRHGNRLRLHRAENSPRLSDPGKCLGIWEAIAAGVWSERPESLGDGGGNFIRSRARTFDHLKVSDAADATAATREAPSYQ